MLWCLATLYVSKGFCRQAKELTNFLFRSHKVFMVPEVKYSQLVHMCCLKTMSRYFDCLFDCDYKTTRNVHLQKHINSIHKGETFPCPFWPECDYKATMNCYLQRHLRSIHWGETFQCSDCDYKATTKSNLLKHVKCIHRGITYPCPECDFKARDKSNLQRHVKSIHRGELFPCPDCNYRASQKGYLQKHIKTRHRNWMFQWPNCYYHKSTEKIDIHNLTSINLWITRTILHIVQVWAEHVNQAAWGPDLAYLAAPPGDLPELELEYHQRCIIKICSRRVWTRIYIKLFIIFHNQKLYQLHPAP